MNIGPAPNAATASPAVSIYGIAGDPLDWLEQKVAGSEGGEGDGFGTNVSVRGDLAIVSAPDSLMATPGKVYVFTQSGGVWTESQILTSDDGAPGDYFGYTTAFAGTAILVGAPFAAVDANAQQGAVYVFEETGGVWAQTAKITAVGGIAHETLGSAIAASGTNVLIGAGAVGSDFTIPGAAYFFSNVGGTWTQGQRISADDGAANDLFGGSLSLDGGTAVVSAIFAKVDGIAQAGAAYVFTESGDTWSQAQKLTADEPTVLANFGFPALQGNTVIIGAANARVNNINQGAAYVFTQTSGVWAQTQLLTPSDAAANTYFGTPVAILDGRAIIGSIYGGGAFHGSAYEFTESGGTWTETHEFTASDGAENDYFGSYVALDDATVLIGSMFATVSGNTWQGAAYFYTAPSLAPIADVAPGSLSFVLAQGETGSDTLAISNTGGSSLDYAIAEEAARAPRVNLSLAQRPIAGAASAESRHVLNSIGSGRLSGLRQLTPWAPRDVQGGLSFVLDDGTYEDSVSLNDQATLEFASIWLNRFSPPAGTGAFTIDTISIEWPQNPSGSLVGNEVDLIAYYDADGDGDPTNAVRIGGDAFVTIESLDTFIDYTVNFSVPGDGDIYVGFENTYALGGTSPILFPAAIDQNSTLQGRSWVAAMSDLSDPDRDNLGGNDLVGTIDGFGIPGNWLIRATGIAGGAGGNCSNPSDVPWLSETPTSGSIAGGASEDVTVTVDASGLDAGEYSALLCVTTNDPAHALIEIPVSVTVSPSDILFANGFD